jgi:hypothetical protein
MLRPTTTAANGNCGPRPPTAKSQADSDPNAVPIYTPPFDPWLAPPHGGEAMRIRPFALFHTGNLSFCRVGQILMTTPKLLRALRDHRALGDSCRPPAGRDRTNVTNCREPPGRRRQASAASTPSMTTRNVKIRIAAQSAFRSVGARRAPSPVSGLGVPATPAPVSKDPLRVAHRHPTLAAYAGMEPLRQIPTFAIDTPCSTIRTSDPCP